ncbi:unnamed protein product [Arctia plantaginis]|uniref:Uncharacterized protein n=1 Tax=Arctia plantaginis TaxID=874455 RepID=A0A8S1AKA6_ARCPL|nr:unnamed protein product [Arctia plantaginis]
METKRIRCDDRARSGVERGEPGAEPRARRRGGAQQRLPVRAQVLSAGNQAPSPERGGAAARSSASPCALRC